jgi:hypothetical protein
MASPSTECAPTAFWADRPTRVAALYWEDCWAAHRRHVLDAVASVAPFASLLEVGCQSGPNLRLLRYAYPDAHLAGLDVNAAAVEYGRARGLDLRCGDLRTAGLGHPDVVLSVYTVAHVSPGDVSAVLARLQMAACRALVLLEPTRPSTGVLPITTWRHDYQAALGPPSHAWSIDGPEGLDTVMVFRCP